MNSAKKLRIFNLNPKNTILTKKSVYYNRFKGEDRENKEYGGENQKNTPLNSSRIREKNVLRIIEVKEENKSMGQLGSRRF